MKAPPASDSQAFDWASLVALVIHPDKVSVIETHLYMGQPLSTRDLDHLFGGLVPLSNLSHHVKDLARKGVLTKARTKRVRGAVETFYRLK